MNEEIKWHINYEPIFTNPLLYPPSHLFQQLLISPAQIKIWPNIAQLPQLAQIYELFEQFLMNTKNWIPNTCSQAELQIIQHDLNLLVATLQCEKQYGRLQWGHNKRTIQASVIHFYLLFTKFISAMIPVSTENILQTNTQDKLITKMANLQKLVNNIINFIRPIYQFMLSQAFAEEQKLTQQFLSMFTFLLKKLPTVHKKSLKQIPKLMEYVIICNSIDEELSQLSQSRISGRKSRLQQRNSKSKRNSHFMNHENKRKQDYRYSEQSLKYIVFGERIKRNSMLNKKKKFTVTTKYNESNEKSEDKSLEFERSRSISPSQDHRSLTIYIHHQGNKQVKIKKRQTFNEDKSDDSGGRRSRNLTNITSITNESLKKRETYQLNHPYEDEEIPQMERGEKNKNNNKKKIVIGLVRMARPSNQMNFQLGKSRGWGIIRQYVQKKIAQRKLKKLLQF